MDQPASDKLQSEQELTELACDTLSFLQERACRLSSIKAEFDLSCIPMALSSQAIVSDSHCLSDKRKWLSNLSAARQILSELSHHIEKRRNDLVYEIQSRSSREGYEKLPDEIISSIFIEVFRSSTEPVYIGESLFSMSGCTHFSLQISQVSRRFRRIALLTPMLWTNISTSLPLSLVSTFLKRSGTQDLVVEARNIDTVERLTEFSTMLIPTRKRWTALNCRVYRGADLIGCLALDAYTSFPRLQELHISGGANAERFLFDRRALLEAPNLQTLSIADAVLNFMLPDVGASSLTIPSYNNLHDVHLENCGGSTWSSLFQAMQSGVLPAVSSVTILYGYSNLRIMEPFPVTYSSPGQQNSIARLEHLRVGYINNIVSSVYNPDRHSFWRTLMSSFYFPNLRELILSAPGYNEVYLDLCLFGALDGLEPERIPKFYSLLFCSQSFPENFDLIGQYLKPLSKFTSVRHLTLNYVKIKSVAPEPPRNAVLPPLVSITIRKATIHSVEPFLKLGQMLRDSPHWNSFEMFKFDGCVGKGAAKIVGARDGWIGEFSTLLEGKVRINNCS